MLTPTPGFDYSILLQDPLSLAAYSFLLIAIGLVYLIKNKMARVIIVALVVGLGWLSTRLSPWAIPVITVLMALIPAYVQTKNMAWRTVLFVCATLLVGTVLFRLIPPSFDWKVISGIFLSPDAKPFSLTFRLTPALIGLTFICFSPYSLANGGHWRHALKIGLIMGCFAVAILIPLSYLLGYVRFDLKYTSIFWLWALSNIFVTCITEEAVFRGMVQSFFMERWQKWRFGSAMAIVIAALIFGGMHYPGGLSYVILASVAGVVYGIAFLLTRKIEAGMVAHFMVNAVHFLAFTYPALK